MYFIPLVPGAGAPGFMFSPASQVKSLINFTAFWKPAERVKDSESPRSGRKHKAWGGKPQVAIEN